MGLGWRCIHLPGVQVYLCGLEFLWRSGDENPLLLTLDPLNPQRVSPHLGKHGTVKNTREMKGLDPGRKGLHFIEAVKAREQMAELGTAPRDSSAEAGNEESGNWVEEQLEEYSCDIPQGAPRPVPAGVFALLPWAKVEEAKELEGQAVRSDHHSFGGRAEKAGQGSWLRVELPFPSHVVDLRESDTKVNCEWLGHIAQMRSPVAKYNRPKPQAAPRTACQARGPGAHGVWEYSSQEALI